jgi:hypothetical protein
MTERDDDERCPGCFREDLTGRPRTFAEALDRLLERYGAEADDEERYVMAHYLEHVTEEVLDAVEHDEPDEEASEAAAGGPRRLQIEVCTPGEDHHEVLDPDTVLYGAWIGGGGEEAEGPVVSMLYEELAAQLTERLEREQGHGT